MKKLLAGGIFVILLAFVPKAFAQCQPIYGGGVTCQNTTLAVHKTVLNPSTNSFVHDMGILDPRFHPQDQVVFNITVSNIGNRIARNVAVFDVVPQFVASTNPPINNGGNTTIKFTIGDLSPGASQTVTVTAILDPAANFPANQAVVCLNNQAQATDTQGDHAQDFSQFCVESPVAPTGLINVTPPPVSVSNPVPQIQVQSVVPTTVVEPVTPASALPPTGADPLAYIALFPAGAIGMIMRKLANKISKK